MIVVPLSLLSNPSFQVIALCLFIHYLSPKDRKFYEQWDHEYCIHSSLSSTWTCQANNCFKIYVCNPWMMSFSWREMDIILMQYCEIMPHLVLMWKQAEKLWGSFFLFLYTFIPIERLPICKLWELWWQYHEQKDIKRRHGTVGVLNEGKFKVMVPGDKNSV